MTLVIDASALVALAMDEPERDAIEEIIADADDLRASAINIAEAGIALVIRFGRFTPEEYGEWLSLLGIREATVDGCAALDGYLKYGKGNHRAGLNLGDCFAYALAKQVDAPLIFKGDDFRLTDVKKALHPT